MAGPGADTMRVHDDGAADALSARHRADAVTVGQHVHLRQGRLEPERTAVFALLVHEATHATAALLGRSAARGVAGVDAEERHAATLERLALAEEHDGRRAPTGRAAHPPYASAATAPPVSDPRRVSDVGQTSSVAARPMTAHVDRLQDGSPDALDLEQLRRTLISDVTARLRSEFERGA
jgi:hypothetical protein